MAKIVLVVKLTREEVDVALENYVKKQVAAGMLHPRVSVHDAAHVEYVIQANVFTNVLVDKAREKAPTTVGVATFCWEYDVDEVVGAVVEFVYKNGM